MNKLKANNTIMTSINEKVVLEGKSTYTMKTVIYIDTPSGVIRESEWILQVKDLIKENKEDNLFNNLRRYSLNELAWINKDEKAEKYALELYAMRIWECDRWVDKELFNQLYMDGKIQLSLF